MTDLIFRAAPYARTASGIVTDVTDAGGIVLDRCLFYPTSGGQLGDNGVLEWDDQKTEIATTAKGDGPQIVLTASDGATLPPMGTEVTQVLNWDARYAMMRMHTALHLLSVVIPLPVTGGQITAQKGRLDFNMAEPPEDKEALAAQLNALIAADHAVSERWITDAELDANPGLVKTMSVEPPRGSGHIRLVQIGTEDAPIDLQPCGGTHVASTAEIGPVRIGKIENKGRQNRRVNLFLENPQT